MADHKHLLHELLKENQEPFKLKSYISEKRSQLKKFPPVTTLQVKKRSNLCKNACFFSFGNSPDVRKSPFVNFPSPAMSPCKSPAGATFFLHVPSRTAAVLVEAAMRIQKQRKQKPKLQKKGLFGSLLKRLKDRSKNKAIGDDDFKILRNHEPKQKEITISCSCNNGRLSRSDLEASTRNCSPEELDEVNGDFTLVETRFCSSPLSPFRFSLNRSPSSSGRRTPDFCSPAASPRRHANQEEGGTNSVQGEEEKEQCSPVSVLDPFFEDEAHESEDVEEDDDNGYDNNYNLDSSYANVQRVKQQLLNRLRRFEKLADLDPMELERELLEDNSDEQYESESVESKDSQPLSLCRRPCVDKYVKQVEETNLGNKEIVWGRICNNRMINSWNESEFSSVDRLVEFDFKKEFEEWKEFPGHVEEAAEEVALAIYGVLVEELVERMFGMVMVNW